MWQPEGSYQEGIKVHQMREQEELQARIKGLIIARIAMVTFLLAVFVFMQANAPDVQTRLSIPYFYSIILIVYLLSLFYPLMARIIAQPAMQLYIQAMMDVIIITAIIYVTGGIRSTYAVFYPLVIIYTVLYLGRNAGLIAASAASISYGLLIDLEFYKVIEPFTYPSMWEIPDTAGHVFLRIFINMVSFYLIALLASFVVEKERKTRALLAEKESAFNRLDVLYRAIIESIDAGIMTIDLEGRVKSFNRAAEEITGWRYPEVENKSIGEILPDWKTLFEHRITDERQVQGRLEMPVTVSHGRKIILGCSLSPLRDHDGGKIGDIIIFQDLTAVKEMEEIMERNRRLAFVGEMAAGLAHEIRNPLASISGAVQMLQREQGIGDTETRLMQLIIRSKDQLEGFIKDFLMLARPERGEHGPVSVSELVGEVLEGAMVMPDWNDRIAINNDLVPGLTLLGNREEFRQMFWNLILNAAQAMPAGGILKITARKRRQGNEEGVEVVFSDTGKGISARDKNMIYEPFFTTKERGTGLGLAIVLRIVNGYGGRLSFESEEGHGASFTLWLPAGDHKSGGL
ncbi:MAG: PAS domain S-box protein [Syntrophobacterales bacterium]|nr:PAS domain S-box protein [Syntrophobacterales bacterium]